MYKATCANGNYTLYVADDLSDYNWKTRDGNWYRPNRDFTKYAFDCIYDLVELCNTKIMYNYSIENLEGRIIGHCVEGKFRIINV